MGYTHYWYVKDIQAVEQALPLVASDLKQLLPKLPPLAGWDGKGEPTLEAREISFNGVAPEDCETFRTTPDPKDYLDTKDGLFGFCKTWRNPYDLAVQVALVLLKWHSTAIAPFAVDVTSDGTLAEWRKACRMVEGLGYPVDPLWALGREAWEVRTQTGAVFYIEWVRGSKSPESWLIDLHQHGIIPFAPPFSLSGPLTGFPPGKPLSISARIYSLGTRGR